MKYDLKISICNQACTLIGLDNIVNFNTDTSIRAKQCRELLPGILKTTLETLNYEFSRKTHVLRPYKDGYSQPAEYIALVGLTPYKYSGNQMLVDRDVKFKIMDDILYILTPCGFIGNIEDRLLVYTSSSDTHSDPSSTLLDALAHHLAYYLSSRLGNTDHPEKFYKMYMLLIDKAKEINMRTHNLNVEVGDYNYVPFYGTGRGRLR